MNARHCCQTKTRAGDNLRRPAWRWGRGWEIAGWFIPGATLALIPKCPLCVAAYVALATGIGISSPAATGLRALLMASCVASLLFMTAKRLIVLKMPQPVPEPRPNQSRCAAQGASASLPFPAKSAL